METQKVILPFFYALFHTGFSSEENSSPIVSPQKESALHSELAFISSEESEKEYPYTHFLYHTFTKKFRNENQLTAFISFRNSFYFQKNVLTLFLFSQTVYNIHNLLTDFISSFHCRSF